MHQYSDKRIVKELNAYILVLFKLMLTARRRCADPHDYLWHGERGAKWAKACKEELLVLLEIRKTGRIR